MKNLALATIEEKTDVEIFTGDYLDLLTAEIQAEVDSHEADLSTEASRKKTKSFAAKIAKAKVRADEAGKNLNAERRSLNEKVDERRRQLRDDFDRMRDKARQPVTEWEEAEKAKEEEERQKVIDELDRIERERVAAIEKREAELAAKELAMEIAEEQRIAKEAFEKSEKERIEREAEIKRQAEEKAKIDAQEAIDRAEREKQEAIDKAERDRLQAIEDAKQAEIEAAKEQERQRIAAEQEKERAIKAERDRIAEEKLAEEKAAKQRYEDKKHMAKINNEALEAFAKVGLDKKSSKAAVEAIAKHLIPHVSIRY